MKFYLTLLWFVLPFVVPVFAQNKTQVLTAPNGQTFKVAGADKSRGADEMVRLTLDYYHQKGTNQAGVDVLVVDDKVETIQDRAGAVHLQNKPDPGALKTAGKGFILSAHGAARKWLLANFKIGDKVLIANEAAPARNANGEVAPANSIPCFPGAYYRKVVSSFDAWTGIVGVITLGTPKVDENRLDAKDRQPLDNFSVYMGGRASEQEIDAGLTWEFTKDETGKLSERRNAWRPFWRNETWNSAPAEKQFYWYPGETIQMAVIAAAPGKLRLVIADASAQPKKMFQTEFDAKSFQANVPRQFKRVNAIDQRRNEGKPAQATKAQIIGAEWLQTVLLRGSGAEAKQLPMDKTRLTDMRCASEANIVVTTTNAAKGAEKIDIYGTPQR